MKGVKHRKYSRGCKKKKKLRKFPIYLESNFKSLKVKL